MAILKTIFLILILSSCLVKAANILAVFTVPSYFNQRLFRVLTDALEERGHQLTIISTNPELGRGNSIEIDLHFSYKLFDKALFSMSVKDSPNEYESLTMWIEYEAEIIEKQFASDQMQEFLKNREQRFDAVIVDFNGLTPWFALSEYFNAPLIGISATETTLELHDAMGNAANPISNPDTRFLDVVTFRERFHAWKHHLLYNFYYKSKFDAIYDRIIRKFMPDVKLTSAELKESPDLLLINSHPAMGFVRPMVPKTVQLGFLHVRPPQPLEDEKLVEFIENSDKPIIYFNLGSSIKSSELQENYLKIFKSVFKSLPYNIIWKWEKDSMVDKPDNVFITPWVQQSDLLAHPKIKLFINHGGQLSIDEGIARGVPMIVMPFYGDQTINSLRVNHLGVGIAVNIKVLTKSILQMVIAEIFNGPYTRNARVLSEIVNDEPINVVEKAVWYCEYVIRHRGNGHLNYRGKLVPFYQKYGLDFIGILIILWHLFVKFIKFIFFFFNTKKQVDGEQEVKKEKKNKKKKKEN